MWGQQVHLSEFSGGARAQMSGRMIGAVRLLERRVGPFEEHNNHFDIFITRQCPGCAADAQSWHYGFLFNLTSVWLRRTLLEA